MIKRSNFLAVLLIFSTVSLCTAARPTEEEMRGEIREFTKIADGIYRGKQPDEKDLQLLKDFGIRTIITFRHEKKKIEWEREKAEALGFRFISMPWEIAKPTSGALMREFLAIVTEPSGGPYYFHCRRGVERTGVAEAIYRRYHDKMPFKEAYDKAMDGHDRLIWLRPYTRARYKQFNEELGDPNAPGLRSA